MIRKIIYKEGHKRLKKLLKDIKKLQQPDIYPTDTQTQFLYDQASTLLYTYFNSPLTSRPAIYENRFEKMIKDNLASDNIIKLEALKNFLTPLDEALKHQAKWFSNTNESPSTRFDYILIIKIFWNKYIWPVLLALGTGLAVAFLAKQFGWI